MTIRTSKLAIGAVLIAGVAVPEAPAIARPSAPDVFCRVYPTAVQCRGSVAPCTTCHTAAPAFNTYGASVSMVLDRSRSFESALPKALAQLEQEDADSDGKSNAEELAEGTWPGNPSSVFVGEEPVATTVSPEFVMRRISVAFCGLSATYEEMEMLRDAADPHAVLHAKLDACLKSDYWQNEALVHLADPLVRPAALIGHCGQTLLDFEPDYHLFLWVMTGGRNASEMLTAQYFVMRDDDGRLVRMDDLPTSRTRAGVSCSSALGPGAVPQNVAKPYRAGVLTTANYLLNNTQGTYLPRVSAGIAYRNWFGADIAQYEALYSVPNEPRDIDRKGVKDAVCAACHATLDPLAYAYAYYYGAGVSNTEFGSYGRDRPEVYLGGLGATREIMDDWYNDQPVPHLFGKGFGQEHKLPATTSSLVRLAAEAARSDLFARHLTRLIFREATGGEPEPRDADEFARLWKGLRDEGYSIDKLCHALIDTKAFGAPR
jgi:hypothetical protein